MEYARLQKVNIDKHSRLFAASDIHGRGWLLERLLDSVGFCKSDTLILLGDYIEKGEKSLETVRLIMRLCKAGNAYALQGNCDTLWDDIENGLYCVDINTYIGWRKNSLLSDMCKELSLDLNTLSAKRVHDALAGEYSDIFRWLRELPQIISAGRLNFVHAGLDDAPLDRQLKERCLRRDAFMEEDISFTTPVVCGHMPTSNYCDITRGVMSFMPIQNTSKNIVCIDGGNAVKPSGQVNLTAFEDARLTSCVYTDDLPECVALRDCAASPNPTSVVWNHRQVELIEQRKENSVCRLKHNNKQLIIPNELLYTDSGALCARDYTDFRIALDCGERIKLAEGGERWSLVKKNGVLGWAESANLTLT